MSVLGDFAWRTATAMNPLILPFAVLCGLVLASVAVSFVALFRAGSLAREAALRADDGRAVDAEALRLHRRGDAPSEIAISLGIPRQEVDLLLKVHQIVISNI